MPPAHRWWLAGLLRVLATLGALGLICTTATAESPRASGKQPALARLDSPAAQEILGTAIGPQPVGAMHWPQALEALGLPSEATALRQALLQRWLASLQPAGNGTAATETVAQAIESVGSPGGTARAREAQLGWNALLARQLRVSLPDASVPLPDEIDTLRARLVEQRPGVWVLRSSAATPAAGLANGMAAAPGVFAWVALRNTGSEALALRKFDLDLVAENSAANATPFWSMACELPRYQQAPALGPGQTLHYLCRGSALPGTGQEAGAMLQAAQQQARLRIRSDALDTEAGRQALVTALALPRQEALRSFMAANAACEQRGTCGKASQANARADRAAARATPAPAKKRDWSALKAWGIFFAGVAVYVAIAHYVSVTAASIALFVALAIPAFQFMQSLRSMNTADSWGGIIVLPAMLITAVVPFAAPALAAWTYRTATNPQARHRALQTAGYFVITVLAMALINKILQLLS